MFFNVDSVNSGELFLLKAFAHSEALEYLCGDLTQKPQNYDKEKFPFHDRRRKNNYLQPVCDNDKKRF